MFKMLCLLYWWCFISSFLFRFIIIFSEEEEDSSRRSTTAWCKQRHECYVHCQFFLISCQTWKICSFSLFLSYHFCMIDLSVFFTSQWILNIFGRSRWCICKICYLPKIFLTVTRSETILSHHHKENSWCFVTKIVLTYCDCQKKLFLKFAEILR